MALLKVKNADGTDVYLKVTGSGTSGDPFISQHTLTNSDGDSIDVQHPLVVDGDSIYCKDIDTTNSDIGDFSGSVCDLFDDLTSLITNSESDNPKILKIIFKRTIYAHEIGIGCDNLSSSFGNSITVKLLGSGETVRYTETFTGLDGNSDLLQFAPKAFNGVILEFNTASSVCISNLTIRKALETTSFIKIQKPDDTIVTAQGTTSGNFKMSLEELESGVSVNSNSQLKVTPYTSDGDEGVCLVDYETSKQANVESLGSLKTIIPKRLCGTAFSGTTKDTNFWTESVTGSGSITQAGEITLSTGTTADSSASYMSVRRARKVTGRANQFRAIARNKQEPTANCIRRIGAYCTNDGFFMQYDGITFGVGSRKGGVDTVVENGNFNGNAGDTIDVLDTNFIRLVIEYTTLSAKFFVNGVLIHTITATTESLTNTQDLPVNIELINENGNTTDNGYEVLFAAIIGLGEIITESAYKYIGTNTTTICKYGAGRLRRIINVDNAGTTTIYDNTAASGDTVAVIDTTKALGTLDFDIPFNNGLTVVTATGAKVVVVYE